MVQSPKQRRQRGSHIYPRKLPSGRVVFYAYVSGRKPPRVSLDTSDRAEAERAFRAILAAPDVRRAPGAAPEMTLAELTTLYLDAPHGWTRQTHRTARNRVDAIGGWLEERGVTYASQISVELVDDLVRDRRGAVTHGTINRDLRSFRLALAWAAERGLCNPCSAIAGREKLREAKPTRDELMDKGEEVTLEVVPGSRE